MTDDTGSASEPLPPSSRRTVVASFCLLFAGALIAAGAGGWALAARRAGSDHLIKLVLCSGLALPLTGVAGMRFFWDARRSRRPRRQRAWAILALLWAAYMLFLGFRP